MTKYFVTALSATMLFLSCPSVAQEEGGGATFVPVELYACKFNERKSMRDVDKLTTEINTWLDARPQQRYSALTMTPWYFSAEIDFDFAWMGWWPDGATMGVSDDDWLANGGEFMAKFADISTCNSHANFASLVLKAPQASKPPARGVLSFADCKLKGDTEIGAALRALAEWGEFEKTNGNNSALWAYFPVFGAGDVDYAFKLVEGFESHTMMGEIYDWWGTGGAYQKSEELYGHLLECDSPRVYNFELRRDMNK